MRQRSRARRALAVGAAAAAAYLAGAKLGDARPVKTGGLVALALVGMAGQLARQAATVHETRNRLDALFDGQVGLTLTGLTMAGNIDMGGNNLNGLAELNMGGQAWGAHGPLWMNGANIHLQGGKINDTGMTWPP